MTKRRPKALQGSTYEIQTGCGLLHVTVNDKDNIPFELLTRMGKSGTCGSCMNEAISRTVSLGLQAGVEIKTLIKNISGISCPSPSGTGEDRVLSCADGIAIALKYHQQDKENAHTAINEPKTEK